MSIVHHSGRTVPNEMFILPIGSSKRIKTDSQNKLSVEHSDSMRTSSLNIKTSIPMDYSSIGYGGTGAFSGFIC